MVEALVNQLFDACPLPLRNKELLPCVYIYVCVCVSIGARIATGLSVISGCHQLSLANRPVIYQCAEVGVGLYKVLTCTCQPSLERRYWPTLR